MGACSDRHFLDFFVFPGRGKSVALAKVQWSQDFRTRLGTVPSTFRGKRSFRNHLAVHRETGRAP